MTTISKPATLVILAAGMATRYGSMKQVEGFGPSGETIMEYSIFDAIKAGFTKVVFIIRQESLEMFKGIFDAKLSGKVEVCYAIQHRTVTNTETEQVSERDKPWGTGHALLSTRDVVNEPFCIINADDFYGFDSFRTMYNFLTTQCDAQTSGMIGFQLKNTLSENGSVSRGVCDVDREGNLIAIVERTKIYRKDSGIVFEESGEEIPLDEDTFVSMNCWGFSPAVFDVSQRLLNQFLTINSDSPKAEFFIPLIADYCTSAEGSSIKVMPSSSLWFGVTYPEDRDGVKAAVNRLVDAGEYPANLWTGLSNSI